MLAPGASFPPITLAVNVAAATAPAVLTTAPRVTGRSGNVWIDNGSDRISTAAPVPGDVGGTVPATLALTLGAPATFAPFVPGVAREYTATTTATVTSTAGDATLSRRAIPGQLINGTFALPQPLQVAIARAAGTGPSPTARRRSRSRQPIARHGRAAHRHLHEDARLHPVHDDAVTGRTSMKVSSLATLAAALLVPAQANAGTHWVTTWGASTQPDSRRTLNNVTIRNVVHISVGGTAGAAAHLQRLRRLPRRRRRRVPENTALRVGSVYVGRRSGTTAAVVPGTNTQVTFGGKPTVRISPGSDVVSDPVTLPVTDGDNLAISIYVPGTDAERELPQRRASRRAI